MKCYTVPKIILAPISPTIIEGKFVFPFGTNGMTDESITLKPVAPKTLKPHPCFF